VELTLQRIEVSAFRGIPGVETFELDGEPAVITGPNGTGKSTLGQALEFLLTGKVRALTGKGTGRISSRTHVPNRQSDPDDTYVEATFRDTDGEVSRVRREFSDKSRLKAYNRPAELRELVSLAEQGMILFSRSELLELIVTTPGQRKDQLQQLLDLSEIDERRRQLKRLAKKTSDRAEERERDAERAEDRLQSTLSILTVDEPTIRSAVNDRREDLGATPVENLDGPESFTTEVNPPAEQATHPLQNDTTLDAVSRLEDWLDSYDSTVGDASKTLARALRELRDDREALQNHSELALVERGLDLADAQTDECPLCLYDWGDGELEARLEARHRRLSRVDERVDQIRTTAAELGRSIAEGRQLIRQLDGRVSADAVETDTEALSLFESRLEAIEEELDRDFVDEIDSVPIDEIGAPPDREFVELCVQNLREEANELPPVSDLQDTWATLETAADEYRELEQATRLASQYRIRAEELSAAHQHFLNARNRVLGEVYQEIADRFERYYTTINPDETNLDSALDQTNTGVRLSVGFHGDGDHPPHALHSEGHQDSMGVCLFLALVAELSPLDRMPVILDDVVMSVDAGHRDRVARLLVDELSDQFQFLITTHDERWARQLRDAGLVENGDIIAFDEWTPEAGPEQTSF
jgi:chromosome segregation ATPase